MEFLDANGYSRAIGDLGIDEIREYIVLLQEKHRYDGHPLTPKRNERLSAQTVRAH